MMILDYVLIGVFILMSVIAVIVTCRDKAAAKYRGRRTPESTLMLIGLFFGATAEFVTMLIIRHKTKHVKFMVGLPAFIILHIVLLYLYVTWLRPMMV